MIEIEHTGDGTLVHGTERGDAAVPALKAQGFRWSRNLGAWYLPRTQLFSTRDAKVTALTKQFERDGVDFELDRRLETTTTAAERVEHRLERAEGRRERFEGRAAQAAAESERLDEAAHERAYQLNGQPILIGHYSERATRRQYERIERDSRKSIEEWKKSEYYTRRARATGAEAARLRDPRYLGNKIDRLEAEARDIQRKLDGSAGPWSKPAEGQWREQLELRKVEVDDELGFYRDTREQLDVPTYSRDTISAGDKVRIRGQWREVVKANPKTVAVKTNYSWTDKVPYHEVEAHEAKVKEPDVIDLTEHERPAGPIVTEDEFYELARLTKRAVESERYMVGERGWVQDQANADSLYQRDRDALDEFARQLQDKGVTEEDLEWRAALIANPDYRPPRSLGYVVSDDDEMEQLLEQDLERPLDRGGFTR